FPFRHNDLEHLEHRLRNCSGKGERFICVEAIYSTDGSTPPQEIYNLAETYDARLIVDAAHAVEICSPIAFAQVITFGKALGTHGAIVVGSKRLKQALINFATPCIYTTALPMYALAAITCSYDLFPAMEAERTQLQRLIQLFRSAYP